MSKWKSLFAVLPVVLLAMACGGSDVKPADADETAEVAEESPSTSPTEESAEVDLPSDETVLNYFQGIATNSLSSLDDSISLAVPGSLADSYATYLKALLQASIDGGTVDDYGKSDVKKVDGGYEYCWGAGDDQNCYTNSDVAGRDGKIANFSVNDSPLKGRLTMGNGSPAPVQGLDAQATFISAFETSSRDRLVAVYSIKTGKDTAISGFDATYRSTEGRQSDASGMEGPQDLGRDSLANFALSFPNAKVGGTVTLNMYDESYTNKGTVTFKTR